MLLFRNFAMASKDSTWMKVHFKKTKSEAGGTYIVPRSWVNRSERWSFWPTKFGATKINKKIRDCVRPPARGSSERGKWQKLEITLFSNIVQSYEAAEEAETDKGTLSDQPASDEEVTHSSGSDGDGDTPTNQAQSRNRKVKQMSDFTSGAEFDLSEKEQSTKSQTASQAVSHIPPDVGDMSLSQSVLSSLAVPPIPDPQIFSLIENASIRSDISLADITLDQLAAEGPQYYVDVHSTGEDHVLVHPSGIVSATPVTSTASATPVTSTASATPMTSTPPATASTSTASATKAVKRPHGGNPGKPEASKPVQPSPGYSSSEDSLLSPSPLPGLSSDEQRETSVKKMMYRLLADNKVCKPLLPNW